jgi:hypothetical protein
MSAICTFCPYSEKDSFHSVLTKLGVISRHEVKKEHEPCTLQLLIGRNYEKHVKIFISSISIKTFLIEPPEENKSFLE